MFCQIATIIMKHIYCKQDHCTVNKHYCFLRFVQINPSRSLCIFPKSLIQIIWEIHCKGSWNIAWPWQLNPNHPLCCTVNVFTYTWRKWQICWACFAYGKEINRLELCQLLDGKVFHTQAIICDENADKFIWNSPNLHTWQTFNCDKVKIMQCLDICL